MTMTTINKILVADENEILGASIACHLHRQGFTVVRISSLDLAQNTILTAQEAGQPFDLVVCDILLPSQSGITFIDWLHKNHPEVAVLVVAGFGNADLLFTLLRTDHDSFRKKPVLPQEIEEAILCIEKKKRVRLGLEEISPHSDEGISLEC